MADFSYDSSIAPMKGNFFSDVAASRGLTSRSAGMLTKKYLSEVSPILESQLKTQEDMLKTQYQQLAFKRQQLDLTTAADEARAQRESLETLPADIQNLTAIVNDPNKTNFEKLGSIGQYKIDNSGRFTSNKGLVNLVNSAEETLKLKDANEKQKESLGYSLATQGMPEAVAGVFGGEVEAGAGKQYYDAAKAISERKKESDKAERQNKQLEEQQVEARKREAQQFTGQLDQLKSSLSQLNQMATQKAEDSDVSVGSLKEGKPSGVPAPGIPKAVPFTLKPEDKVSVEEIIRSQNPLLGKKDLSQFSDEELFRQAYRSTTGSIKKLVGLPESDLSTKFE